VTSVATSEKSQVKVALTGLAQKCAQIEWTGGVLDKKEEEEEALPLQKKSEFTELA